MQIWRRTRQSRGRGPVVQLTKMSIQPVLPFGSLFFFQLLFLVDSMGESNKKDPAV